MSSLKKVYIKNYGCQMNVYDGQKMADLLKPHGYAFTETPDDADVAILNTCHIREKAEHKVFSDLGRLNLVKNNNRKDMIIAVGGCVGQAEGEEIIRQAPYVSMVFGPQSYHRLPQMLAEIERKTGDKRRKIVDTDFPVESKFDHLPLPEATPAVAFLSIQEGCDKFCHFCVVPYTRGAEYSRPAADVLKEAKRLIALGAKEITLLGQNVNAYHGLGLNGGDWSLGRLIFALAEIDGLARIRYTTSHPRDMSEELYEAHAKVDALMPFVHLPAQSGSDRILAAMNRKHTVSDYLKIIERLRSARATMAFSSDFIIGYPGESSKDHASTLKLIEEVGYAQAYSFKYSPRPGTPASVLPTQILEEEKTKRLEEVQNTVNRLQLAYNRSFKGKTVNVLFEKGGKFPGQIVGKTPHMQSVVVNGSVASIGDVLPVAIDDGHGNSLSGSIVSETKVA